ncbi:type I secretion system permease/ATPase [Thalassotalea euphylliae]|uniref:Type I secretion system permease/ATPase n=1 Tax=Thalassotalea euphylliae TaxID=1655234 RepID=A0A3E0U6S1_9GAMM|nr:type I secretion system permease/ATPase [Thalassotalea euphylliae]REL32509.1 type I secretion system permease/ATPase [Thalassotalea euphylliae]
MTDSNTDELPFYRALSQLKRSLVPVILFSCVINILMLVSPLYMLQVYDRVLISASQPTLLFLTLFAIAALMVLIALDSVRSLVLSRVGCRFENDVASYTFKNILEQGGHSQPLRDIETVRSFISSPALAAIMDAPWTPLYLGLIYVLHPWLGHLALAGAIVLFTLALIGESLTRKVQSESTSASGEAYRFTDICARQQSAVYAMGMANNLKAKWREPRMQSLATSAVATQRSGYISSLSKGIRFSLQVGILGMGAFLVIQQESSPGVMIAASIIMGRGLAPIEACISGWRLVIQARDAKARLIAFQQHFAEPAEPLPLPAPVGNLAVKNIIYQFDGSESPLLKDISFHLSAGTVLGITGPNAAGKTTLGKLLLGLVNPIHGEIRLDNATYDQWDREQLGPYIGYLPQEVELFPGSIAENIARFNDASPEQIMEAGQLAGVHDMILHLEQGYNCAAGDFGEVLSGGQRQRVALARAVFGQPKLVLLDEPTSSLDAEAERSVMKAIVALKQQGATVIVIGHRPALMNVTDQLLVLRDGRIAAFGETQEIMSQLIRPVVETKSS